MDEARRCARVGLLRRGRLIAEGAPEAVVRDAGAVDLEDAFLRMAGRLDRKEAVS
jgi:ABC-2 type transport system ATP-binding protein